MTEPAGVSVGWDGPLYGVVGGGVLAAGSFLAGTRPLSVAAESVLFFTATVGLVGAVAAFSASGAGLVTGGEDHGDCIDSGDWAVLRADSATPLKFRLGFALAGTSGCSLAGFLVLVV